MPGPLFLPEKAAEHERRRSVINAALADTSRRRCPAAEIGTYSDSGNHYCKCLAPGELVATKRGQVPVEELTLNDVTFGRDGQSDSIWRLIRRESDEHMITVRARKALPIRMTANHMVLVSEWSRSHGRWKQRGDVAWKEAGDLEPGDHLLVPRLGVDFADSDEEVELARFWGRYVGDGFSSQSRLGITFGHHEDTAPWAAIADRYYGNVKIVEGRTATTVQFGDITTRTWAKENCGADAHSKRIPWRFLGGAHSVVRAFLAGYASADGWMSDKPGVGTRTTTVSRGLAQQVQLAIGRLGVWAGISVRQRPETTVIEGRTVNQHGPVYAINLAPNDAIAIGLAHPDARPTAGGPHNRMDEEHYHLPIEAVERTDDHEGFVYDLTTTRHAFLHGVTVSHNCGVESVPGRPAHFPLEANPLVALTFCLGDYDHPERGCPTWIARNDDQEKIDRVQRAKDRASAAAATRRHIESGLRVDDAGIEDEEREREREIVFNAQSAEYQETAARLQKAAVEAEHERRRLGPPDPEREAAIARAKLLGKAPNPADRAVRYRVHRCTLKGCPGVDEDPVITREEDDVPRVCPHVVDELHHELKGERGVYSRAQATAHYGPMAVAQADQAFEHAARRGKIGA